MSTIAPTTGARAMLRLDCDVRILVIVLVLLGIGMSLVASSSSFFAGGVFSDQFALTRRHVVRVLISLVVLAVAMHVDYRVYRRGAPAILAIGIGLMCLLFPLGETTRNVDRWLSIPGLGTSVQPSDLARLSLVIFIAWWVSRTGRDLTRFRSGFLPPALAMLVIAGLIARTPNYGTALATLLIAMIMLFAGGARLWHLASVAALCTGAAAIRVLSDGYVQKRVMAYLDQGDSLQEMNWQVYQSLIALGSGGLFGVGFGDSEQKLSWLPDAYTDFIFSVLGEEAGLAGTLIVSGLFLMLVLRALKVSRRCGDTFGEMLVIGIGATVFVYAMLNMCVATGLFPVTGLPLPFLSYGGSALVVNAFAIGILLNVSRGAKRRERGGAAA